MNWSDFWFKNYCECQFWVENFKKIAIDFGGQLKTQFKWSSSKKGAG